MPPRIRGLGLASAGCGLLSLCGGEKAKECGSIRHHFAWDDTTAKTRIGPQNDGVSHSWISRFVCVNGLCSLALIARFSVTMPIVGPRTALDLMKTQLG